MTVWEKTCWFVIFLSGERRMYCCLILEFEVIFPSWGSKSWVYCSRSRNWNISHIVQLEASHRLQNHFFMFVNLHYIHSRHNVKTILYNPDSWITCQNSQIVHSKTEEFCIIKALWHWDIQMLLVIIKGYILNL